MSLGLFPYPPRPGQLDVVDACRVAFREGGHAVIESATGTGKTVCALTAALEVARERGKRVLYLTRTNAQERQVVLEYRRLGQGGTVVALQGRTHLCPLAREDPDVGAANAEELGVMCRDRCKAVDAKREGKKTRVAPCRFYERTRYSPAGERVAARVRAEALTAEELVDAAGAEGACPYVVSRDLLPDAEVVVAPFVYFFHQGLRHALMRWCDARPRDFLVVVDEAHNLPDYARDLGSARLGRRTIDLALAETEEFADPGVMEGVSLSDLLRLVRRILDGIADEYLPAEADDAMVPPDEVEVALMTELGAPSPAIERAVAAAQEFGAAVRDARRRKGKVPRSYAGAVADFLVAYARADPSTHVRLVSRSESGPVLECYAVDPSVVTDALHETTGSVHVSGTLTPLDEYRDSVGLGHDAPCLAFPSPFPAGNRLALLDPDVTTRWQDLQRDPGMWDAIARRVREFRDALPGRNVAVFVPSYDALARVTTHLDEATTIADVRGAKQDDLMRVVDAFKESRGRTLVSVMGGRLAEGLDFPDATLEAVVIAGLPYPRPSARQEALVRFNDRRFGRGWDYAVRAPMVRRVMQAAGRVIRSPTDRGVVLLLDKRAALLRDVMPDLRATREAPAEAARFLDAKRFGR